MAWATWNKNRGRCVILEQMIGKRSTSILLPAVTLALAGLCGCDIEDFNVGRVNRDFHYSYPLKAGGRLEVESFNGGIEITAWDQNMADISGTKYAPTESEADALRIEVNHAPDSISVRAVRPYERRGNRGVRFAIKVPRSAVVERATTSNGSILVQNLSGPALLKTSNSAVRARAMSGKLDIRTSNGPIELDGVDGDVVAQSSNGHIRADGIRGSLDAGTSNAHVSAMMETPGKPVRVESSNGGVDLKLPPNFNAGVRVHTSNSGITLHLAEPVNADVSARTSNSSVTSEFDVRVHGEVSKNHMDAVIGAGGPLLDLSTSNGAIRLVH
jgi:hypothetical protein